MSFKVISCLCQKAPLLEQSFEKEKPQQQMGDNKFQLLEAAEEGNFQKLQDLLRKGEPSFEAIAKIFQFFFSTDLIGPQKGMNPNVADYNGNTPLHFAALQSSERCLKLLLDSNKGFFAEIASIVISNSL